MEMKFNQSEAVFDDETNEAMYGDLPIEDLALIAECINYILKKDAKK